jgi:predicted GNAT superfamily acetyltransferase
VIVNEIILEWETQDKHVTIRDLISQDEFKETENIQREVWGFGDLDIVPAAHITAAKWAGGVAMGAFESGRMIGFVYGFPAMESGHISMHSHMLAVRKEYRRLHAGVQLKLAQRKKALEMGMKEISWTFDPLQALNARLNFARLGVISNRYLINFYGEETSSPLHRGVGTDRLWVRWLVDSERVKKRAALIETDERDDLVKHETGVDERSWLEPQTEAKIARILFGHSSQALLACIDGEWMILGSTEEIDQSSELLLELPGNIGYIKKENLDAASSWRWWIQERLIAAFGQGYTCVDFFEVRSLSPSRYFYRLVRLHGKGEHH